MRKILKASLTLFCLCILAGTAAAQNIYADLDSEIVNGVWTIKDAVICDDYLQEAVYGGTRQSNEFPWALLGRGNYRQYSYYSFITEADVFGMPSELLDGLTRVCSRCGSYAGPGSNMPYGVHSCISNAQNAYGILNKELSIGEDGYIYGINVTGMNRDKNKLYVSSYPIRYNRTLRKHGFDNNHYAIDCTKQPVSAGYSRREMNGSKSFPFTEVILEGCTINIWKNPNHMFPDVKFRFRNCVINAAPPYTSIMNAPFEKVIEMTGCTINAVNTFNLLDGATFTGNIVTCEIALNGNATITGNTFHGNTTIINNSVGVTGNNFNAALSVTNTSHLTNATARGSVTFTNVPTCTGCTLLGDLYFNTSAMTFDMSKWTGTGLYNIGASCTLNISKMYPAKPNITISSANAGASTTFYLNGPQGTANEFALTASRLNGEQHANSGVSICLNGTLNLANKDITNVGSTVIYAYGQPKLDKARISGSGGITYATRQSGVLFEANAVNIKGPAFGISGTYSDVNLTNWNSSGALALNCTITSQQSDEKADQYKSGWINLTGCTFAQLTGGTLNDVYVSSGSYTGNPASTVNSVTVKTGTFVNTGTTLSALMIDSELSKIEVGTDGPNRTQNITLLNPPVIIDWADFPGIDIDIDMNAPTIEVIRQPQSSVQPTEKVTLTVRCKDPDDHDHNLPLSINGGAFQASPINNYTVTENQAVTIIARDANGNTRSYVVNVENIDMEAPEVLSITQSNNKWTRDAVVVRASATDDVKLHASAYMWEFTPNSAVKADGSVDKSKVVTGNWTADKTYRVVDSGTVRVRVRDALWDSVSAANRSKHESWSEPYAVSNIDKIAPTATYTLSTGAGQKVSKDVGVTVQLNIIDNQDPVTFDSSGLSNSPVMWDKVTQQWSHETTHTFYENGVYQVRVRDAVGNMSGYISITINQIAGSVPVIDAIESDHLRAEYVTSPVTMKVYARDGTVAKPANLDGYKNGSFNTKLPARAYSWDDGRSWTSVSTKKVYANGEYTVMVRDSVGNTAEESVIVENIDAYAPTASVYLFKGPPSDGSSTDPLDYVWKIRVEADDLGSGVERIDTLWDSGTHSAASFPIILDIEEPGVYGCIVYDKAGNKTYAEKTVTWENLGESSGGAGSQNYTGIKVPSTGSAGEPFNCPVQDLIFYENGAYNTVTGTFTPYLPGQEGITVNIIVNAKTGTWVTGYGTFNGVKYPATFDDGTGNYVEKVRGKKEIPAKVFIPFSTITSDVKNGRIKIVIQEWKDEACTELVREGTATLYASAQVSKPVINYTYNRPTDELTLIGSSSVGSIDKIQYDLGSGLQDYTGPFHVNGAETIRVVVTDKTGAQHIYDIDGSSLGVSGSTGGSLPTTDLNDILDSEGNPMTGLPNSYHIGNRAADIYIIGGTRSNTNSLPSGDILGLAG